MRDLSGYGPLSHAEGKLPWKRTRRSRRKRPTAESESVTIRDFRERAHQPAHITKQLLRGKQ
jgi:hypothetical protein